MILALAAYAVAAAAVEIIHASGEPPRIVPGEPVSVEAGVLQLRLSEDLALSARAGSAFVLHSDGEGTRIEVLRGSVLAVTLASPAWAELTPGTYLFGSLEPARAGLYDLQHRPGTTLGEGIMLRQSRALRIDTRDFLRGLFSVLRAGPR